MVNLYKKNIMKKEKLKKLIVKIINEQKKETKKSKPIDFKKVSGRGKKFDNKKALLIHQERTGNKNNAQNVTWRIIPSGVDYESPGAAAQINNYDNTPCGTVKPSKPQMVSPINENKK